MNCTFRCWSIYQSVTFCGKNGNLKKHFHNRHLSWGTWNWYYISLQHFLHLPQSQIFHHICLPPSTANFFVYVKCNIFSKGQYVPTSIHKMGLSRKLGPFWVLGPFTTLKKETFRQFLFSIYLTSQRKYSQFLLPMTQIFNIWQRPKSSQIGPKLEFLCSLNLYIRPTWEVTSQVSRIYRFSDVHFLEFETKEYFSQEFWKILIKSLKYWRLYFSQQFWENVNKSLNYWRLVEPNNFQLFFWWGEENIEILFDIHFNI